MYSYANWTSIVITNGTCVLPEKTEWDWTWTKWTTIYNPYLDVDVPIKKVVNHDAENQLTDEL